MAGNRLYLPDSGPQNGFWPRIFILWPCRRPGRPGTDNQLGGQQGDGGDPACSWGNFEAVVDAAAGDGDDDFVAIFVGGGDDHFAAFLLHVELEVGKEVAEEFGAAMHAEGAEAVSFARGAGGEGEADLVGVDEKDVVGFLFRVEARRYGECADVKAERQVVRGGGGQGIDAQFIAVLDQAMGRREEFLTAQGFQRALDLVELVGVEAVAFQQSVEPPACLPFAQQGGDVDGQHGVLPVADAVAGDAVAAEAVAALGKDLVEQLLHLAEMPHFRAEGLEERGIDPGQFGEHFVPDAVARDGDVGIGRVDAEFDAGADGVRLDFPAAEREQRADKAYVLRARERHVVTYAGKAAHARAAQQVQQQRLGTVVEIVGYGQVREALFAAQLREPAVAQFARRHFHGQAVVGGIRGGIGFLPEERHVVCAAPRSHQGLIAVAVGTPQMEIEMRYGQGKP